MFRFENSQYLLFLALPLILAAIHYIVIFRKRALLRSYGDVDLVRKLMIDVSRWRPELKFWLGNLALLSFIIALSRPQFGTKVDTRERKGIEAIIALDVSNSMLAEDVKPNRLEKAKMMISNMIDGMKDDKIGLVVYAGQAFTQLPITSDYVSAKMFLETISPSMMTVQGTDIAEAINLSCKSFTRQEGVSRAIFLITDGEDNEGGAVEAAKHAAGMGIRVYILGIGDANGAPIPIPGTTQYIIDNEGNTVVSRLNEEMCREIATAGSGSYIYVDNSSSAQRKLAEQVDKLAKTTMESQIYSEYDEQYQGFVLLGIILLILDAMLLERSSHLKTLSRLFVRNGKASVIILLLAFCTGALAQNDRDYIRRGNRSMRDTLYAKAQVDYQKAVEADNANPQAHYNLGNSLLFQNKAEDAMKEYETASRFEKSKKRLGMIYHNMGVLLQSAKQFDKAVECYRNSLRNDPTSDETRYNYALCLFQLKKGGGQDNQDQEKDENGQDEKKEQDKQQQQEEKEKQQKENPEQQQNQQQMSKENAEQMLKAAMQDEKNTQERMQQMQQMPRQKHLQKQW